MHPVKAYRVGIRPVELAEVELQSCAADVRADPI